MEHPAALRPATIKMLAGVLMVLGMAACREQGEEYGGTPQTAPGAEMPAGAPSAPSAPGALSDGNIAAILSASNLEEIQPSRMAQERAQNQAVKDYANRMVSEHTRMEDSLAAMVRKLNITPAPNETSSEMQSETQQAMTKLQNTQGAEFDKAYMEFMVSSHQKALDALNSNLIPATQNQQLKTALEQKVRPMVESHLQMAKQVHGSLR